MHGNLDFGCIQMLGETITKQLLRFIAWSEEICKIFGVSISDVME